MEHVEKFLPITRARCFRVVNCQTKKIILQIDFSKCDVDPLNVNLTKITRHTFKIAQKKMVKQSLMLVNNSEHKVES